MLVPESVNVPVLGVPVDVRMFLIFGLASPVLHTACCAPPVSATQPARRGRSERVRPELIICSAQVQIGVLHCLIL